MLNVSRMQMGLNENKIVHQKNELTGIFVGNFIRMAADSSSGDPRNVKNFSKKNSSSLRLNIKKHIQCANSRGQTASKRYKKIEEKNKQMWISVHVLACIFFQ